MLCYRGNNYYEVADINDAISHGRLPSWHCRLNSSGRRKLLYLYVDGNSYRVEFVDDYPFMMAYVYKNVSRTSCNSFIAKNIDGCIKRIFTEMFETKLNDFDYEI